MPRPVEYLPYNSQSRQVARSLSDLIAEAGPDLLVEHIGSTAVPGCWGKGIIDLLVQYAPGGLEIARSTLDKLGFQRQGNPEPFPESRPMRVGSVDHLSRLYRVHAHVLQKGSGEARDLIRFRDLLRNDQGLRRAYEAEKRMILARGITKGTEYSNAKGEFIRRALALSPDA
ncbi:MAG: GrpB family protein [Chloroflexota bacterium]